LVVSDATGRINLALFEAKASLLMEGDIISMTKVFAKEFKNQLTLYKTVEGELFKIGDFTMVINEENNLSKVRDPEETKKSEVNKQSSSKDVNNNNKMAFKNTKMAASYSSNTEPPNPVKTIPIVPNKFWKQYGGANSSTNNWQYGGANSSTNNWREESKGATAAASQPRDPVDEQRQFNRISIKQRLGPKHDALFNSIHGVSELKQRILQGSKKHGESSLFRQRVIPRMS
jgi:hypothetical protein